MLSPALRGGLKMVRCGAKDSQPTDPLHSRFSANGEVGETASFGRRGEGTSAPLRHAPAARATSPLVLRKSGEELD